MNTQIKSLIIKAIAVALIILMSAVPNLGYIPTPWVHITIIHIPVIIISMLYGKRFAIFIGIVFATSSLVMATLSPNIFSFIFSPFYKAGEIGGGWQSIVICYVPRILMALGAALVYNKNRGKVYMFITAGIVSYINTILVIVGIYIFYIKEFAQVMNISVSSAFGVLSSLLMINGTLEAFAAAILTVGIVPTLSKIKK